MEAVELSNHAQIRTAMVFRTQAPQEAPDGNVRALAIRDLVSAKPLRWDELPRISVDESLLGQCLQPGDVVIPSRGITTDRGSTKVQVRRCSRWVS